MNVLALCAGYGGLELGLGMATGGRARTVCYVERDAYAASVLMARMEDEALERAPVWDDLTTFDAGRWRGVVDLVSAGFPCQPWSVAGKRKGTEDERWIWPAIVRIVRECGAPLVFFENVPGLLRHGLREVLSDLAEIGFDAEWEGVSAAEVGAPHRRERIFILAYDGRARRGLTALDECRDGRPAPQAARPTERGDGMEGQGGGGRLGPGVRPERPGRGSRGETDRGGSRAGRGLAAGLLGGGPAGAEPRAGRVRRQGPEGMEPGCSSAAEPEPAGSDVADPLGSGHHGRPRGEGRGAVGGASPEGPGSGVGNAERPRADTGPASGGPRHPACESGQRVGSPTRSGREGHRLLGFPPGPSDAAGWERWLAAGGPAPAEPAIRRGVDGPSSRMDELRTLGNGVVPAQAALAFRILRDRVIRPDQQEATA